MWPSFITFFQCALILLLNLCIRLPPHYVITFFSLDLTSFPTSHLCEWHSVIDFRLVLSMISKVFQLTGQKYVSLGEYRSQYWIFWIEKMQIFRRENEGRGYKNNAGRPNIALNATIREMFNEDRRRLLEVSSYEHQIFSTIFSRLTVDIAIESSITAL